MFMRLIQVLGVLGASVLACSGTRLATPDHASTDPDPTPGPSARLTVARSCAHGPVSSAERVHARDLAGPRVASTSPAKQPAAVAWSLQIAGSGREDVAGLATDDGGNVLVAGQFTSRIELDSIVLDSQGQTDAFIAKLTPDGEVLWAHALGDRGSDFATAVAVDGEGNAFVLGMFERSMTVAGTRLRALGTHDVFVAAFSPTGEAMWGRSLGSSQWEFAGSLAIDQSGDVALAGAFRGALVVGGGKGARRLEVRSEGEADAFLVRLAYDGQPIWSARLGGAGWDEGNAVAVDGNGDVLLAGASSPRSRDGSSPGSRGFVAKYAAGSGNRTWLQRMDGPGHSRIASVSITESDQVILTGSFTRTTRIAGHSLTSAGDHDLLLVRLDADGQYLWSKHFGGARLDCGRATSTVDDGGFFLAGAISGSGNVGGPALPAQDRTPFVARYDSAGDHDWSLSLSGIGAVIHTVASGRDQMALVAGSFSSSLAVAGTSLVSHGALDGFVIAFHRPVSAGPVIGLTASSDE